jgi:hypothetical protein
MMAIVPIWEIRNERRQDAPFWNTHYSQLFAHRGLVAGIAVLAACNGVA